jgi:predicted N-formylglutamate amidohydrolase
MSDSNLLLSDEPLATRVERPEGISQILLTADHAGRRIPQALGNLGLAAEDLERHIAWDIGIAGVTLWIAERDGLDYPEIEIRQDLTATEDGQIAFAARLARLLPVAVARLMKKT